MSESTRRKILQAAHRLIIEERDPKASMARIAREAGVSRQAVYLHFDGRSGLLLGLVDYTDEEIDIAGRVGAVVEIHDPVERLLAFVEVVMRFEPELYDATIVFDVERHADEAIAEVFQDRMDRRLRSHRRVWQPVADAGRLRDDFTAHRAAQATWAMTTPAAYRTFVVEAGWELDEWIAFVRDIVEQTMITPP